MNIHKTKPDYIFEVSWEICNKVGGIHTVISTKALTLVNEYNDNLIMIGPDVWKGTSEHPEFIEDYSIYKSWREKAFNEGIKFKIGRWNIAGTPVVILVDFTPFFSVKDKIFTELWEKYKLDSLAGHWDYIEPALFGHASAKIIESFYNYYLSSEDRIVAQFHEWMTGTGLLYLKEKVPQVGCIFTTHATTVGRSIAGNALPLYKNLETYDGQTMANRFDIKSKFSLEKISANESDCFTTVSKITAAECKQFFNKEVDIVTPNGFEDSFVPDESQFEYKRQQARKKILDVGEAALNQKFDDNTVLLINSGRYEFKNKGIDLFIDALGDLNKRNDQNKQILAVIAIPGNQSGPVSDITVRIGNPDFSKPVEGCYLTHYLHDKNLDPIIKRINENNLFNKSGDKVKIIFAPCYLDGKDGIFNMAYYDLLIGFDMSVFPSYYEPWGYTPLESLAFSIPTITTSLAGFGKWINETYNKEQKSATIIKRTDDNDNEVINEMVSVISDFVGFSEDVITEIRKEAFEISRIALWKNLVPHYLDAYQIALEKTNERSALYRNKLQQERFVINSNNQATKPEWKKILIKPVIPETLSGLQKLSKNLWWTWNEDAEELFELIDETKWEEYEHNPVALLENLSIEKLKRLEKNKTFLKKLHAVIDRFDTYMDKAFTENHKQIAYFSMEYGLHDSIKIFSGGLGVLAGDYLKEASDSNVNMVGVGLLFRYGYFQQTISFNGEQQAVYFPQKFTHLPVIPVRDEKGEWVKIKMALPGRTTFAKVWRVDIGRIPLYLLDTDIEENSEMDRSITHQLYGGNWENRFKQELLLGVGGIRLLDSLGVQTDLFHCNEGHAAFIGVERLRKYVQNEKLTFSQSIEIVRATTLFTTHTPVPAGHDAFDEDLLRTYIPHYAERLNISWDAFMNLGRVNENNTREKFSLSVLAAKLSQEMNGVSEIHGTVSREMFKYLYSGFFSDELHIDYVTNGVHFPTWTAKEWKDIYKKKFNISTESYPAHDEWQKINEVPDEDIWNTRKKLRTELIDYLQSRIMTDLTRREENPHLIIKTIESFDENALTIGFARRFATYKRAQLLFTNLERLSRLVNNKQMPVQFIFAGKAHPNDKAGQELIKRIIEISKKEEFVGKITFVENYDLKLAKKLIHGVDLWLNTPTRPLEASGTSGEKAVMNGVLNFSVLDGWWAEGYRPGAGWAIKEERTYANQRFQDELDAEMIYLTFEESIIPLFYNRDKNGIPVDWVSHIKKTISEIAPRFTMNRMLNDYYEKFYNKMIKRSYGLKENNYDQVKALSAWKRKVINNWDGIEIISQKLPDSDSDPLSLGAYFNAELKINFNELSPEDFSIQVIFGQKINDVVESIIHKEDMVLASHDNNIAIFRCKIPITKAGVYDYVFRAIPNHPLLPHQQDFNLVKWL
ncbi:alpha-glucan family phosphorylase [candidate division KSB1 bacterium]